MNWNKKHGNILKEIYTSFKQEGIRYFILRNYKGLPFENYSKDVDIIVEPNKINRAKEILEYVYKENGISHLHIMKYGHVYCFHGISIQLNIGIHIDLIASYVSNGAEIFSFDELYLHVEDYNGFKVLNSFFEGVMVFIYKQFNYKRPVLKYEYKELIYNTYKLYPEFEILISKLVGSELSSKIFTEIKHQNFDEMLNFSSAFTKALNLYALKKDPIKTLKNRFRFYYEKIHRMVFRYRSFSKVFSVIAPDGAGKTTFIEALINEIDFYYVNNKEDQRCHVYHFRPNLLPNLGELGERAGIIEQDKDFTNPHRAKPANVLSSLIRISYYWLDYVIGYRLLVRKDVQYDKFSVFDRYGYDLIVDPSRTRLNLPLWLRKIFVRTMPQPKLVFYLDANPDVIYKRKQELTLEEITRQNLEYKKLVSSNKHFISLDSNREVEESVKEALEIIINKFTKKL